MPDKIPLFILENLFYCFVHKGEAKYWLPCMPKGKKEANGYIVAEADGSFHHTHQHPFNTYDIEANTLLMGGS